MNAHWLIPTAAYVTAAGGLGVVSKLALQTLNWQHLLVWMGVGYAGVVAVLLALGDARLQLVGDTLWAVFSAVLVVGGLVVLYEALATGDASKVVPVSSAYPAVTLFLSGLVLSEPVSLAGVGGVCLVVAGVVVLTTAR
jgi:transporter family protein